MSDIPKWRIRQALPSEVKYLSELAFRSKSYWGYSDRFMQACLEELTLDSCYIESNSTFVIEVEGNTVGFYSLEHVSAFEAELGYLFVEPMFIGKGYGRKLMAHAQQKARHLGYNQMTVQGDPNAEQFYRAAGGAVVGTRKSTSIPDRELPVFRIDLRELAGET
ncbi:GNAT family N-acetyltransferase [Candidatus Poribacteria bacterium]|nr:GNAT family N-acetyltransferase [Candidatus Poribacteria bacterium]